MKRLLLALAIAACGDSSETSDAGSDGATRAAGIIFINEVMPSNAAACADPFGEFDDWVELYNASDADFDLSGLTLSDDAADPKKSTIPAGVSVPAHGFKLLWLDDQVQGIDHFPFKLNAAGEEIAIYATDGSTIDSLTFGEATTDVSFARTPDGTGAFVTCATATCGASNTCGGQ